MPVGLSYFLTTNFSNWSELRYQSFLVSTILFVSKITPEVVSQPNEIAFIERPYSYVVGAIDVDGSLPLQFTAEELPNWLTLIDNGDGTARLTGQPAAADQGAHTINLQVMNGDSLIDTQTFTLEVKEVVQTVYLPVIQIDG